jgi:hypothetical protein
LSPAEGDPIAEGYYEMFDIVLEVATGFLWRSTRS